MENLTAKIAKQIDTVIKGKSEVTVKILRTLLANGHVLLDDMPGVGKTTFAVVLGKATGLCYRRIQFTPDVMPSDIVGFTMYDKVKGSFVYHPGTAVNTNLLLCDEINRTSSKTQSALLETMQEGQVTVDGEVHLLEKPFIVIATQNPLGTAGTQPLPFAQMDRFMVRLSIGHPGKEAIVDMLRSRQDADPLLQVQQVATVQDILRMQNEVSAVNTQERILQYIAQLVWQSQHHKLLQAGISPRGALYLDRAAKANAYMDGRDYVTGQDVQQVFFDVCEHRVLLKRNVSANESAADALKALLRTVTVPDRASVK